MSQTQVGHFENPNGHFFTFAEPPPYHLALSWRCPWHVGKLNGSSWLSPSTAICPCMNTKDSQGLPTTAGPRIHPRVPKLPLLLLSQSSTSLVLVTSALQVSVLKLSCHGFELLPAHPRSSNVGKALGVHFPIMQVPPYDQRRRRNSANRGWMSF